MKYRVLVFPCGSECGLEIGRSLNGLKEVELFGASSVDDHGKFAFQNYVGGLPYVTDENFIERLNSVLTQHKIQYIYPAMDSVVDLLARNQERLNAEVIGSCAATTQLALSKAKTYQALSAIVRCPRVYTLEELQTEDFPVFLKPEVGCGSQGVLLARTRVEVERALEKDPSLMILENLPGDEYTIDCFTDSSGSLLFAGPRKRRRVAKGISVNTVSSADPDGRFRTFATSINSAVSFNGAWFFQVKHAGNGELALLEIAPRIAGSMGLQRCKGVNLPLLSLLNLAGTSVSIRPNDYEVEFDRALCNKVRFSRKVTTLYLDFDDCFLMDDEFMNTNILKLIGQFRNSRRKVVLISRHRGDLEGRLDKLGVRALFDEVIHLKSDESKALYLKDSNGLLLDDSFAERLSAIEIGVPALGPESVEALFD
jgi:hypothetical protein